MRKHMLVVGRSREIHAKVAGLGFRISVIVAKAKLPTMDMSIYERVVGLAATSPVEEWVAVARAIHAIDPVEAVGGLSETTQHLAAAIAEDLQLPYASREVIRRTRDKFYMREILRPAGLDDTPSRVVRSRDEVEAFAAEHGYPIVLKPRDGLGKMGFSLLLDGSQIPRALDRFEAQMPDSDILVERFIEGKEYSVDAFSEGGRHQIISVSEKFKEPEAFIEIGHCVPAAVDESSRDAMTHFVLKVLDEIGVENGPSHTEVMFGSKGPRVVETHARLPGGAIVDLVKVLSGVDLDDLWIRQLAGESVLGEVPGKLNGFAASAFAVPKGPGTVRSVEGEDEVAAMPGVALVRIIFDVGTEVSDIYDSDSRGAGVLARGETAESAVRRSREAVDRLKFDIS